MTEENLVSRRSKRSTAGNRMQAALAEFAFEELSKEDLEEDKDFIVETYEEDAFESDFQSTDEDEPAEEPDIGDNEEKQARKAARSKLGRAAAAAETRQKVTFDPSSTAQRPSTAGIKRTRRVSLGLTIDAHTGEIIADNDDDQDKKRSSRRQATIQNTTATVKRYLKSEEKKASQPRKRFKNTQRLTQAQLLARALDTEEGNVVAHRDYLMLEEEKRNMRAKRDKVSVTGPLLRWISRAEEVKVEEPEERRWPAISTESMHNNQHPFAPPSSYPQEQGYTQTLLSLAPTVPNTTSTSASSSAYFPHLQLYNPASVSTASSIATATPYLQLYPTSGTVPSTLLTSFSATPYLQPYPTSNTVQSTMTSSAATPYLQLYPLSNTPHSTVPTVSTATTPSAPSSSSAAIVPVQLPYPLSWQTPGSGVIPSTPSSSSAIQPLAGSSTARSRKPKTEKVVKSYLVHELVSPDEQDSDDEITKPDWESTMEAMFGDHVRWRDVMVYTGKNRPMGRYTATCPITGINPAKYFDPRTGVPFANVDAYKILTRLRGELVHDGDEPHQDDEGDKVVWDDELGCYVGDFVGKFMEQNQEGTSAAVIDLTV